MVNVIGVIGNEDGEVNLLSVISQVQSLGEGDIHVNIDSIGGDLDVGFAIYNYLSKLPNKVTTECSGNCASAASIVFLAGETRIAGCPIMIHNPYLDQISGDRQTLESLAEWIGAKEKECELLYSEKTNIDVETLSALMDGETYISPSQALSLGFATQIKTIAVAKLDKPSINKKESKMSTKAKSLLEKLKGLASFKVKAMELTAADGSTLVVQREEGEPQVGDEASPDGEFTMTDGPVITVVDGKITDIATASNEGGEPSDADIEEAINVIDNLVQENEDLKAENDKLKEEVTQAKAKLKSENEIEILNAVNKAGGKDWLAKHCSHYRPQGRTGSQGKQEFQTANSSLRERIDELKKGGNK